MPNVLENFAFDQYRRSYKNTSKLTYTFVECPKQGLDNNCGCFVIKFADMLISGEDPKSWDPSDVMDYMKNWSINLVCHALNKIEDGYETPPEKAGHDYHEYNDMKCTYGNKKKKNINKKQKIF
ncbi:uncharacterized protein LOC132029902 [Lycium ferocissimum]|uniref:uncharacterized protein LOC132029902 n=1 Tax=Lycium ferocissimum TaxID=112874 RepID=UPI002815DCFB|nr:uncharacterized protein LOC132029902 [Lycium ferocissimum]XP_059275297.1 uncharacterized protein LOC132029902 [Lycium ferocissimum]